MKTFEFKHTQIQYRVSGKGDPVIFLHGFLENHSMWDNIAPKIRALGFKIILIDLPCHGGSRFEGEICTMHYMAASVDAICTKEMIENPIVFGHSMGGYVALELLKIRPAKVTLVHSNFWDDSEDKKMDRNRVVKIVEKNKMRLINEAIPNLFADQNRGACHSHILNLMKEAENIPSTEIIAATKGMRDREHNGAIMEQHEITIIHGELDTVVKTEKLKEEVLRLAKTPIIHNIPNAGHMSIWEQPTDLLRDLLKVISKSSTLS